MGHWGSRRVSERLHWLPHHATVSHTWRVQAHGCYMFDNGVLGSRPAICLRTFLSCSTPVSPTSLAPAVSHAAPKPNSVDLSEPQESRIANAFASAVPSNLPRVPLPRSPRLLPWQEILPYNSQLVPLQRETFPRLFQFHAPSAPLPCYAASVCPHCMRFSGPIGAPVLLIPSNVDLRGVSGDLWFTLKILTLSQRLISYWPACLSPLPSACRVTFSHLAHAAVVCCGVSPLEKKKKKKRQICVADATGLELLPSLHEFMAIRAVSPALASGQNCGVRAFHSREIALTSLHADQ